MDLIFKSDRLMYRPLDEGDLDIGIDLLTDPQVMRYVGDVMTKEEVAGDMQVATRRCGRGCIGIWCLADFTTGEKVGTAFLLPMPVEEDDTNWDLVVGGDIPDAPIEVGYLLKKSAWGKGYATEACRRMVQFAFEETLLEELVATTDAENLASQRVLLKSGLLSQGLIPAYAGHYPGFRITRGQWQDGESGKTL
ncbi:MAG: GNAT family N-acetyltransferase [Rhodobacteraceae bacterium]|nr:GNAT family N-acetyltransferase [Paracoccaceae bacterium]